MIPDDDKRRYSCGSVPASDEAFRFLIMNLQPFLSVPGEDTPPPVDNTPAIVDDYLSSSRRLLAYCCDLSSLVCALGGVSSLQHYVSPSNVLSWIRVCWRFGSATVAPSGGITAP